MKKILFFIGFLVFFASISVAQDNDSGFFSPDFAKDPLATGGEVKPDIQNTPKIVEKDEKREGMFDDSAKSDSIMDSAKPKMIQSLGLIVNGLEKSHFDAFLKKLVDLANDKKLNAGRIYAPGMKVMEYKNVELLNKLLILGGSVNQTLPSKYNVKRSPTWIVATEEGEYLLEGLPAIERYISANGKFISPQS